MFFMIEGPRLYNKNFILGHQPITWALKKFITISNGQKNTPKKCKSPKNVTEKFFFNLNFLLKIEIIILLYLKKISDDFN